jgi:hypothetical protein
MQEDYDTRRDKIRRVFVFRTSGLEATDEPDKDKTGGYRGSRKPVLHS